MPLPEESFLIPFLRESTQRLRHCGISEPTPLDAIRANLLQIQATCLEEAVVRHNSEIAKCGQNNESSGPVHSLTVEQAQRDLRSLCTDGFASPQVRMAVQGMNDAARHAFCQLALYSECLLEVSNNTGNCRSCPRHDSRRCSSGDADRGRPGPLKSSGRMGRDDVLEFIGLCEVAVRLGDVQRYLGAGNSSGSSGRLFADVPLPGATPLASSILPQDRLEFVQRLLLRAIGYDPAHGHGEIRRIFFDNTHRSNEFSNDADLMERFVKMSANMDAALTQATLRATLEAFGASEGVTCVSSTCTRMSDEDGRQESPEGAINQGTTQATVSLHSVRASAANAMESRQTYPPQTLQTLPQTPSKLNQEILGELLTMGEEERTARLEEARKAEREQLSRAPFMFEKKEDRGDSTEVPMSEDYDEKNHRLLLTGRIWSTMLQQNGGQPPKFQ
jgi:hypothetical protein